MTACNVLRYPDQNGRAAAATTLNRNERAGGLSRRQGSRPQDQTPGVPSTSHPSGLCRTRKGAGDDNVGRGRCLSLPPAAWTASTRWPPGQLGCFSAKAREV